MGGFLKENVKLLNPPTKTPERVKGSSAEG